MVESVESPGCSLANRYPGRATRWKLRKRSIEFAKVPRLMGIVNVTPDSFSDGGRYLSVDAAYDHAMQLVDQGADILDVGGESTRPYSEPVTETEELQRVIPVVERLARETHVPISIDTSKAAVAREALSAGAEIVNDVTGLEGDPKMVDVVLEHRPGVCAMHMQGTPQTMQDNPSYSDVTDEIFDYLKARRDELLTAGLPRDQICLDPGIGFGKTHLHNLTLMRTCGRFHELQCPVLVGHSRKGFLGKVLGRNVANRSAATAGAAVALAVRGIQIVRVHDVGPIRDVLLLFEACGGMDGDDSPVA